MQERRPYRPSDAGRRAAAEKPESNAAWIAGTAVVVAGIFGLLVGLAFGGGEPETRTQYVTDTVTVARTVTAEARVRTVTVPADDALADADLASDEDAASTTGGTTDEDCAEDYVGACIPADATDVLCSDLSERDISVIGEDVYGLDPDGDGTACES